MTVSLHTATVGAFLQVLEPLSALLGKARAHCAEQGLPEIGLIQSRLADDMWPLDWQVRAAVLHSKAAIEALASGIATPDFSDPPADFAGLTAMVDGAIAALKAVDPAELEKMAANDVAFVIGERRLDFTGEDYLFSFAIPNFYFHTSMAYAILRNQGLAIGKRDFLGAVRTKG